LNRFNTAVLNISNRGDPVLEDTGMWNPRLVNLLYHMCVSLSCTQQRELASFSNVIEVFNVPCDVIKLIFWLRRQLVHYWTHHRFFIGNC